MCKRYSISNIIYVTLKFFFKILGLQTDEYVTNQDQDQPSWTGCKEPLDMTQEVAGYDTQQEKKLIKIKDNSFSDGQI